MDRIIISNLEVYGYHGVYPEENALGQMFLIDAVLFLDTLAAGRSDDLADSVSYGDVIRLISKEMTNGRNRLLEKTAQQLADAVLLAFDRIRKVEITVKKPWAPVKVHLDYAGVSIERGWHRVYVGAGSNMGDREAFLALGAERLKGHRQIREFVSSTIIETEPWGYEDQDRFLNAVYGFDTLLSPDELLCLLQSIENEAGRKREIHWGPRTLDLDLLLYDNLVTEDPRLVIPHPEMTRRLFVLEPLCQLIPYGIHPLTGERFNEIRRRHQS